jgi:hypothetical protein
MHDVLCLDTVTPGDEVATNVALVSSVRSFSVALSSSSQF